MTEAQQQERTSADLRERLGLLADKADNCLHAANLPVPPATHVEGLTAAMREIRDELREIRSGLDDSSETASTVDPEAGTHEFPAPLRKAAGTAVDRAHEWADIIGHLPRSYYPELAGVATEAAALGWNAALAVRAERAAGAEG